MTGASFANLLGSVAAAEVKPVKVYVSSLMHSVRRLATSAGIWWKWLVVNYQK